MLIQTGTISAAVSAPSQAIETAARPPLVRTPLREEATTPRSARGERQPGARADSQRLDQRAGRDRERQQLRGRGRPMPQEVGGERRHQRQQEGRGQLLDAAPEAVSVEQRGLRAEERDQRPDPGRGTSGLISAYRQRETAAPQQAR